jgi:hypothetical protein
MRLASGARALKRTKFAPERAKLIGFAAVESSVLPRRPSPQPGPNTDAHKDADNGDNVLHGDSLHQ